MSVKIAANRQYVQIVNRSADQLNTLKKPPEGWLSVMRKALGMSGAQVAKRVGVSRNAIYQAERNERDGAITINQMQKLAEAMGGRFVYAIIPEHGHVEDVVRSQAHRAAELLVQRANAHMALEQQSLSQSQTKRRIDALTEDLIREMPADFWEPK
ncbi:mobile mystery protein A [Aliidiomarina halalkaliphila]|uniref:Mobile mystery protein A n=1 Tax=Aliidiomarina halalkaliphila TaxID=2593535 RepID=A0A552X1H9_9GAMM|nr:mobile mystery protein A [Aliidiomarina halalkaliphila]TRW48900.1 mobile mystery protein A [Aliidiomarina halalkaliphila]